MYKCLWFYWNSLEFVFLLSRINKRAKRHIRPLAGRQPRVGGAVAAPGFHIWVRAGRRDPQRPLAACLATLVRVASGKPQDRRVSGKRLGLGIKFVPKVNPLNPRILTLISDLPVASTENPGSLNESLTRTGSKYFCLFRCDTYPC